MYCVYKTNFYSLAYYTIVRNHLRPEGALLWEVYCTIIIGLCYCELWFGQSELKRSWPVCVLRRCSPARTEETVIRNEGIHTIFEPGGLSSDAALTYSVLWVTLCRCADKISLCKILCSILSPTLLFGLFQLQFLQAHTTGW
jgi:hypothetical protein